jgi:hypothetical protein
MKILITESQYKTILNEVKMPRNVVRQVVRDLTKVIKEKESGTFYFPMEEEQDFYEFNDYPVDFSVELTIKFDDSIDRFKINGSYSLDDEVVEVLLLVNPEKLKSQMYDIIGELNILVAHELEHGLQQYYDEFPLKKKNTKSGKKYYTSPEEIPAEVQGFRRLAKLKDVPFKEVVKDWFKDNRDIHKMNEKDEDYVIQKLLDFHKKKYGK